MQWFIDLVTNPYFMTPVLSWFVAQVIKTIIHRITSKTLAWSRMVGDGGMPSCHSATVASLAFLCLLVFGAGSFQFAISVILAIIVCHDAMGVRNKVGIHARILNTLVLDRAEQLKGEASGEEPPQSAADDDGEPTAEEVQKRLNEFVGHTPAQVFVGVMIGIGMAILMYCIWFVV